MEKLFRSRSVLCSFQDRTLDSIVSGPFALILSLLSFHFFSHYPSKHMTSKGQQRPNDVDNC